MKPIIYIFLITVLGLSACGPGKMKTEESAKKIVLITGEKSHPATLHEYIKNVRLLKTMLDNSGNVYGIETSIVYHGWPEDISILEEADLMVFISDGRDGPGGVVVPFMTDERMAFMKKQMERGCGLMTFHFSTFTPDKYGKEVLEWVGGYFDWQNDQGEREWYSDIEFHEVEVELPSTGHPIMNGVKPFTIFEEYYFDLRFNYDDPRLTPIVNVKELESDRKWGGLVAWAIDRENGSRGFGTTLGHLYANWRNEDYRKLFLNAIVWAAGADVPSEGVESRFFSDREVTNHLFGSDYKGLILTGNNYPGHIWQETTPVLKKALEKDGAIHVDVSTNINDLHQYDLRDYDFLVFNYCNWEVPNPLWNTSKEALKDYVEHGGGLMFIHFSNGAFHYSLPEAGESDWPYYRKLCRRVWDHDGGSIHDKFGAFTVNVLDDQHEITSGISDFQIEDELYYNQKGDEDIHVLMTAKSKDTGKDEPQAFIYEVGSPHSSPARVFQTVLGHDAQALEVTELQEVLLRAGKWCAKGSQRWNDL